MKHAWKTLPEDFLLKISDMYPQLEVEKILNSFTVPKPTTFRINKLKYSFEKFVSDANTLNISYSHVDELENAFILNSPSLREFTDSDIYKNGKVYVQSLSSMIPPLVLYPSSHDKVLDLCAAPGSKTTQMAAMMNNAGFILANDNSFIRLEKLKSNLLIQGVTNTTSHKSHAETIWKEFPEYFDKTLVDVPCSMEGRFNSSDPKSYDHWTQGKVKFLAEKQKYILRSAISATKVGGTIVYATCTISPEENESIIDWALKKHSSIIEINDIKIPQFTFHHPLTAWRNRQFSESISKTVRVSPSAKYEGFYIAKLTKISSNIPHILLSKSS